MLSFKNVGLIIAAVLGGIFALDHVALAQESAPAEAVRQSPREQQLREQLKGILQELEELKQGRESAVPPSEQPKTVTEKVSPEQSQAPERCRNMN